MFKKRDILDTFAISSTILVGLGIYELVSSLTLGKMLSFVIVFFSSVGFYEFLYKLIIFLFGHVNFLLKLLWGKQYLKGYWIYYYYLDDKKRYGVWFFNQTIDSTEVKGYGITSDGRKRSDVQSVTDLIKEGIDYEIVNRRTDISDDGTMTDSYYYSKTTMHFESRNTFLNIFNYPIRISARTQVYGGQSSGAKHQDVTLMKCKKAKCENDAIEELLKLINSDQGQV